MHFYGLLGYRVDRCYHKHGFPPGYGNKSQNRNQSTSVSQVNYIEGNNGVEAVVNKAEDACLQARSFPFT